MLRSGRLSQKQVTGLAGRDDWELLDTSRIVIKFWSGSWGSPQPGYQPSISAGVEVFMLMSAARTKTDGRLILQLSHLPIR